MKKCSNHPSNFPTAIHKAWKCKPVFSPWTECPCITHQCKLDCTFAVKSENNTTCGDAVASHSGILMTIIMTLGQKNNFSCNSMDNVSLQTHPQQKAAVPVWLRAPQRAALSFNMRFHSVQPGTRGSSSTEMLNQKGSPLHSRLGHSWQKGTGA